MSVATYPHGIDLVWLAVDASGFVGAFITAGEGPIPESALAWALEDPGLEAEVLSLPVYSEGIMLIEVPLATSFVELASRGIFVYDWQDVHRTMSEETGQYELVCRPRRAIMESSLPSRLRAAASATALQSVSFGSATQVLVRAVT